MSKAVTILTFKVLARCLQHAGHVAVDVIIDLKAGIQLKIRPFVILRFVGGVTGWSVVVSTMQCATSGKEESSSWPHCSILLTVLQHY